jgi:hypothetical protein
MGEEPRFTIFEGMFIIRVLNKVQNTNKYLMYVHT